MKKSVILAVAGAALLLCSCATTKQAQVFGRFVPERYDDFVFENNLIAGRIYGKALESCGKGQITSPGVDVWVKIPGALVCDQRYKDELQNHKSYHINWGNGKDCYKVGRSLGAGASAPVIDGEVVLPATNFRSYEILENTAKKFVFVLNYPEWESNGEKFALSKKITVVPNTYFCKVEDTYTFSGKQGDVLNIAAGVNRHPSQKTIQDELKGSDRYAIWEKASDQSVEKEDGMIGVAVVVPGATKVEILPDGSHGLVEKQVKSGEPFVYYFGSCWSKGDIKSAADWFKKVEKQK